MRLFTLVAASLGLICGPVVASSLRVDPVQIDITDDQRSAAVTVTNMDDGPVTIHAYPMVWTQSEGKDRYADTSAMIVSPPVVTIAPGEKQTLRVGFRNPKQQRGAWRLVIDEVPPRTTDAQGVRVALRMNLPVFARMSASLTPNDLAWSAWRSSAGDWIVEAINSSEAHIRIDPNAFVAGTGLKHTPSIRLGVVLPHSRRRWHLQPNGSVIDATQFQRIARTGGTDEAVALASSRD